MSLSRRQLTLATAALALGCFMKAPTWGSTIAEFRDQLRLGLQARLPEEFQFIDRILQLVEQGHVPRDLVQSTFQWARKKRPYPFQFFKRGLIVRAARRGIVITP